MFPRIPRRSFKFQLKIGRADGNLCQGLGADSYFRYPLLPAVKFLEINI